MASPLRREQASVRRVSVLPRRRRAPLLSAVPGPDGFKFVKFKFAEIVLQDFVRSRRRLEL